MSSISEKIHKARDLAANYRLVEQEEIAVDLDGRQTFEKAVDEALQEDRIQTMACLVGLPSFSTTSWKEPHSEASGGKISWPWTMQLTSGEVFFAKSG